MKVMGNKFRNAFKYTGILVMVTLLVMGCGSESNTEIAQAPSKDEFQSYQLDMNAKGIALADLIQEIEIVRLEETEASLLSAVRQIEFFEDRMVLPSGNEGDVFVYSDKGEFIRKINRKGEGPEEYSGWNDIWLEGDILNVYTAQKSIKRYDLEGNFISTKTIPHGASHIHPYKSGYVLDMNYGVINDSLQYAVAITDGEMKVKKLFLPFEKAPDFGISTDDKTVFPSGEDLFVFRIMTDTVFKLDGDSLKPYIHYDFGDQWYYQSGVEMSMAVLNQTEEAALVWLMSNRIGENYIFLSAIVGMKNGAQYFIDRNANKEILIDLKMPEDEKLLISSIGWDGDDFLFTIQSPQLSYLLEGLDQEQYSFAEGTELEAIESSENPVLIRMKLKDSTDW